MHNGFIKYITICCKKVFDRKIRLDNYNNNQILQLILLTGALFKFILWICKR